MWLVFVFRDDSFSKHYFTLEADSKRFFHEVCTDLSTRAAVLYDPDGFNNSYQA